MKGTKKLHKIGKSLQRQIIDMKTRIALDWMVTNIETSSIEMRSVYNLQSILLNCDRRKPIIWVYGIQRIQSTNNRTRNNPEGVRIYPSR